MSAIAGIWRRNRGPVNIDQITRMIDRLSHRGPDGGGQWHQGSIGLAHCMLQTTPESVDERLPLQSKNTNLVITADARIDNRAELMASLDFQRCPGEPVTDSALILAAYEKWGEFFPQYLVGAYVFAIWDEAKQRLYCARDHIGLKPFYYHLSDRIFVFASEIKALFCVPEVPRVVNDLAVGLHLSATESDGTITFFEKIERLLPAHSLIIDQTGVRLLPYWSMDPDRKLRLASDAEYIEGFREHFLNAVRCRLRSAYPIGIYLSGGVDSSSVASTARHLLDEIEPDRPLHTFSTIFPDLPEPQRQLIDERKYVDVVVNRPGMIPHFIRGDRLRPLTDMARSTWYQDGIYYGPTMYMEEAVCAEARSNGVRTLLTGIDGDTVVSHGWEYLPQLAASGHWLELIRTVTAYQRNTGRPFSRKQFIWDSGFKPLIDYFRERLARKLKGSEALAETRLGAIKPEFAQQIQLQDQIRELELRRVTSPLKARTDHWRGMVSPLNAYILEVINKASNPYAIEERHPFYDRRLMEYCLAIPPRFKLYRGWPRGILRFALHGILPPEIQWRWDKADLSQNFRYRLLHKGSGLIDEMANDPTLIEPYVNIDIIRQTVQDLDRGAKVSDDRLLALYQCTTLYAGLKWLDFDFRAHFDVANPR